MNGMRKLETPASLFVGRTPPIVVLLTFLGGGNLTENCSKSVRRIEAELDTNMSAMPARLIFKLKEYQ